MMLLLQSTTTLLSILSLASATEIVGQGIKLGNTFLTGSSNPRLGVEFFGGIPFAEPPVGKLRLKPPVLKTRLNGRMFDARRSGNGCLQPAANMTELSEDCLSIDIYRPASASPGAKLPVIVWVFGGGFTIGAASQYDGSNLVARSIARGTPVIYVSHNYRLGLLGLPQGQEADDRRILNLALKDHLAALEWVQANIASFGGDKSKVTVFGQSSGAQIISALMFNSPLHKLAQAAILESGSPNSLTSLKASQWETSWQAFVTGVPSCMAIATSGKTLDCLSKANTTELFSAVNLSLEKALTFGVTIDGPTGLLPDLPSRLLSEGRFARMPFIAGTNLDEGTIFVDPRSDLSTNAIHDTLINIYGPPAIPEAAINATVDQLLQLYPDIPAVGSPYDTGNKTFGFPSGFKREASILGDTSLQAPRRRLTQAASRFDAPVYGYLFAQPQPAGPVSEGVPHGAEIAYVYATTPDSSSISKIIMDYWLSFSTSLSPNDGKGSQRPLWPQYTAENQVLMQLKDANLTTIPDTYPWNFKAPLGGVAVSVIELPPITRRARGAEFEMRGHQLTPHWH